MDPQLLDDPYIGLIHRLWIDPKIVDWSTYCQKITRFFILFDGPNIRCFCGRMPPRILACGRFYKNSGSELRKAITIVRKHVLSVSSYRSILLSNFLFFLCHLICFHVATGASMPTMTFSLWSSTVLILFIKYYLILFNTLAFYTNLDY